MKKLVYLLKIHLNQSIKFLINGRENTGTKQTINPKGLIDYIQTIDNVYENLEDYNPTKKRNVLIVLNDMIADMESGKKISRIVTELFLRGTKLNISLFYITILIHNDKNYKIKCNILFYLENT